MESQARENERRPVVGILGGICSGKTTVAKIFENKGFMRIDADSIVHALLDTSAVRKKLREAFGDAVFDAHGSLNRKALADRAFEDHTKLAMLNSVLHPPVIDVIERRIAAADTPVVLDAALLSETGLDRRLCTVLIFVDRGLSERLKLAVECRGWGPNELLRREAMQQPLKRKREKADLVVPNKGSIGELEENVKKTIEKGGF